MEKISNSEYTEWILQLKDRIKSSQLKAITSVNKELLKLYWELGKSISLKLNTSKWGASVVEQLSKDLKDEFPNQKGFSRSNLFSMKKWFEFYTSSNLNIEKVQQLVGQIPWGHNLLIVSKSKNIAEYALRGMSQPIRVAAYEINKSIPEDLKSNLPTIEDIEEELSSINSDKRKN